MYESDCVAKMLIFNIVLLSMCMQREYYESMQAEGLASGPTH